MIKKKFQHISNNSFLIIIFEFSLYLFLKFFTNNGTLGRKYQGSYLTQLLEEKCNQTILILITNPGQMRKVEQ